MKTRGLPRLPALPEYGVAIYLDKFRSDGRPSEGEVSFIRNRLRESYESCEGELPPADFIIGPTITLYSHDGRPCATQWDDEAYCELCAQGIGTTWDAVRYQYAWYAAEGHTPKDPL